MHPRVGKSLVDVADRSGVVVLVECSRRDGGMLGHGVVRTGAEAEYAGMHGDNTQQQRQDPDHPDEPGGAM